MACDLCIEQHSQMSCADATETQIDDRKSLDDEASTATCAPSSSGQPSTEDSQSDGNRMDHNKSGEGDFDDEGDASSPNLFTFDGAADSEAVPNGGVKRPPPPSHSADGQALRRAARRYKLDSSGKYVKGKLEGSSWMPEQNAPTFDSLKEALEHEKQKTALRRTTWPNLLARIASTKQAVEREGAETRQCAVEEANATRQMVKSTKEELSAQMDGIAKILSGQSESGVQGEDDGARRLALFSRLLAELRVEDLRLLLLERNLRPVGRKPTLAHLAVLHVSETDLNNFVTTRSKHQRVDTPPVASQTWVDPR